MVVKTKAQERMMVDLECLRIESSRSSTRLFNARILYISVVPEMSGLLPICSIVFILSSLRGFEIGSIGSLLFNLYR